MLLRIKQLSVFRCGLPYTVAGFLLVRYAALLCTQRIQTEIRGDAAKPCPPFSFACGLRWCAIEAQEYLLSDIIRFVALPATAVGKLVDQGIVARKNGFERLFV